MEAAPALVAGGDTGGGSQGSRVAAIGVEESSGGAPIEEGGGTVLNLISDDSDGRASHDPSGFGALLLSGSITGTLESSSALQAGGSESLPDEYLQRSRVFVGKVERMLEVSRQVQLRWALFLLVSQAGMHRAVAALQAQIRQYNARRVLEGLREAERRRVYRECEFAWPDEHSDGGEGHEQLEPFREDEATEKASKGISEAFGASHDLTLESRRSSISDVRTKPSSELSTSQAELARDASCRQPGSEQEMEEEFPQRKGEEGEEASFPGQSNRASGSPSYASTSESEDDFVRGWQKKIFGRVMPSRGQVPAPKYPMRPSPYAEAIPFRNFRREDGGCSFSQRFGEFDRQAGGPSTRGVSSHFRPKSDSLIDRGGSGPAKRRPASAGSRRLPSPACRGPPTAAKTVMRSYRPPFVF